MKRYGNLYEEICSIDNLKLAEKKARKGKQSQYGVKLFDRNSEDLLINLHHILMNNEFKTSEYTIYKIFDGKEREIYRLPYYPDRIVHHAILNKLESIFVKTFTTDTYSCIKKRGIHKCLINLNKALRDRANTYYCLKLDIRKFYPSIDNTILKCLLKRKFKDVRLLSLLNNIIDSCGGLPVGNYLSQHLANFYLSYFDHWLKEVVKVKYYFRYCDDIVILDGSKGTLRSILNEIKQYLEINLKLTLSNYQIFPVESRGIDFLGYVSFHTHILLRKTIKLKWINMLRYYPNKKSKASYNGWLLYCNSINLKNKYLK